MAGLWPKPAGPVPQGLRLPGGSESLRPHLEAPDSLRFSETPEGLRLWGIISKGCIKTRATPRGPRKPKAFPGFLRLSCGSNV